jgi:hypothetical protein
MATPSIKLRFAMFLDTPSGTCENLPVSKIDFDDLADLKLVPIMIQSQGVLNDVSDESHVHLIVGASIARYEGGRYLLFFKSFLWETKQFEKLEDFPPFDFADHDDLAHMTGQETWLLSESQQPLARLTPLNEIPDTFKASLLEGFQGLFRKHGMGADETWKKPLLALNLWPAHYGEDHPEHLRHDAPFDIDG